MSAIVRLTIENEELLFKVDVNDSSEEEKMTALKMIDVFAKYNNISDEDITLRDIKMKN